jgi:disulfide bond formation protein DsbB
MDTETASLFFSLLSLVALAGAVAIVAFGLVFRFTPLGERMGPLRHDLGRAAVPLAFVVALTCTAGSLYFSEVATFVPCKLCWFQRVGMYSLTVFLGVATFRRARSVRFYVIPQAAIASVVSLYHSKLQWFPDTSSSFCTLDAPCTERHVFEFGFVTIPFMALCGFAVIIGLMFLAGGPDAPDWSSDRPALPPAELNRQVLTPLAAAWVVVLVPAVVALAQAWAETDLIKPVWFTRVALIPLALVLGIATFRRDPSVRWYVVPVAAVGTVVAVVDHSLMALPLVVSAALTWWAGHASDTAETHAGPQLATV